MKVKVAFNGYLGFEPFSTFVELMQGIKYLTTLEPNYKMIKGEGTNDIIFQGVILQNLSFLKWVCCRLMAENHYLSVILDVDELEKIELDDLVMHRIILVIDEDTPIIRFCKVCEKLTENDIVLAKTGDVKVLNLFKAKLDKIECRSHLYVDMSVMDIKDLTLHRFNTIYPYMGEN